MRLLAIDDLVIDDESFYERPMITDRSNRLEWSVKRRQGVAGSVFFGGQVEPARWNILFKCNDLETRDALLAVLGGDVSEERRLLAIRDDVAQTRVLVYAAPLKITEHNELDISVDFESSDSAWCSESAEETTRSFASTLDQAMHLVVPGNTRTSPRIILTPTLQRSSFTATVGFRYRRRYVVTNSADEPLYRYPLRISLGDTTPLTTTKAQADGDDVRVVIDGIEVERTLVTWDTAASYVWFIVEALPVGESMTVEVWYGNASATNPPVLAYPNLPPLTLASSSNAAWVYPTARVAANAGKGLWYLSKTQRPPLADFTVPGSWRLAATFSRPNNDDFHVQGSWSAFSDSGSWVLASLEVTRAAAEASDSNTPNAYDGIGFSHPLGITSINAAFAMENPSAMARLMILVRESSASDWYRQFTYATTGSTTIGATTYTPDTTVHEVAIALWPQDYVAIPEGTAGFAQILLGGTTLTVNIETTDLSITGGTEEEIYELATELRIGGGQDRVPPYRSLLIGNARSEAGAGVSRVGVVLGDECLVIEGEGLTHDVWADDLSSRIEAVSAHAITPVVGFYDGATTQEGSSNLMLPLTPARIRVPNGTFDADISNWIAGTTTASVTATRSWDATVGGDQLGSLKVAITPNSAGAGAQAETVCARFFAINGRDTIEVAGWSETSTANITPRLRINWYDKDETFLSASTETDWTPVGSTEYRRTFAARVPAGATQYRIVAVAYIDGAAATGTVWFDDITTNDVELMVADVAMGEIDVTVALQGRWL